MNASINISNNSTIQNVGSLTDKNINSLLEKIEKFNTSLKVYSDSNSIFKDLENNLKLSGLIMLGGMPASGKTTLAIQLSLRAIENKQPVLFHSFEMSKAQILERFRIVGGYNSITELIKSPHAKYLFIIEFSDFLQPAAENDKTAVKMIDLDYNHLKHNVESLNTMFNCKVLLIMDSLNEIPNSKETDAMQKVDTVMLNLRFITDNTDVCSLIIAQASKSKQNDKALDMNSFKGSASIEYTTDKIILLNSLESFQHIGFNDNEKTEYQNIGTSFENEITNPKEQGFCLTVAKNRYGKFPQYYKYKILKSENLKITGCELVKLNKDNGLNGFESAKDLSKNKSVKGMPL